MLERLHLKNVGPAPYLRFEPAQRLNLITGDNGLGKSCLLDVAWCPRTISSGRAGCLMGCDEPGEAQEEAQGGGAPLRKHAQERKRHRRPDRYGGPDRAPRERCGGWFIAEWMSLDEKARSPSPG